MNFAKITLSDRTLDVLYGTPHRAKSVRVRVIDHIVTDIVDYYIYQTLCSEQAIILVYGSKQCVCKSIDSARYTIDNLANFLLPF